MIKPFIPMIYDKGRETWICGDEEGNIVLATNGLIGDMPPHWKSDILRAIKVPEHITSYSVPLIKNEPLLPPTNVPIATEPEFEQVAIELQKAYFDAYTIRAGFSKKANTWVYHDWFEYEEDSLV
jgi:hypothetical protein